MSDYEPLGPLHMPTGALILCDTVIRDASSGRLSAINTFNSIAMSPLPGVAKIRGIAKVWGIGAGVPITLKLSVVDRSSGETVFSTEPSDLPVEDPFMMEPVLDVVLDLEVPIEETGVYEVRLAVGDLTAATHPLWVIPASEFEDDEEEIEPIDEA